MSRFGATILDAEGLTLSADEIAFFREANPFGFILFRRNLDTPDQIRALCAQMREAVGRDALITIDQEGGQVQRLRGDLARLWQPPLAHIRQAGPDAERAIYIRYRLIAAELQALGIDSNCAPMADLVHEGTHPFLRDRCFGDDPAQVALLARAAAEAQLAGGVLPVLKHIPGHGRANADSHFELPRVDTAKTTLSDTDFAPFRALNDLPLGMTAHVVFADIDTAPATLSKSVMDVIRDEIGFDGLVMTDDLGMKALKGTPAELSRRALAAGCDVILHCNAPLEERCAVAAAAGEMSDAAQRRAEAALAWRRAPDDIDIPALEAELDGLMRGHVYG